MRRSPVGGLFPPPAGFRVQRNLSGFWPTDRNTQATDIGGHPSAILEKSKSTDRSLKNDGPDPLLEVDQNTIYVCILMAKPT
jgi:hypothetical protein